MDSEGLLPCFVEPAILHYAEQECESSALSDNS
jgi:hypothetical protein